MEQKISIIIPTFNRADYLSKTIASVLRQSCTNFEIIVVDDGSVDNTRELVLSLRAADDRIKYFHQENNGRSTARNLGIKNATGKWLMFLDSDDMLCDEALVILANEIGARPDIGLIGGKNIKIDENDSLIAQIGGESQDAEHIGFIREPYIKLIREFYLSMGSYIVDAKVVHQEGGFCSSVEPCEDYDFLLNMATKTNMVRLDAPILQYRKHGDNTPSNRFYVSGIKVAHRHLRKLDSILATDSKRMAIAEWRNNIADDYFHQRKSYRALYNYILSAFYNRTKLYDKSFRRQFALCLIPYQVRQYLKIKLLNRRLADI